ncbi:MAG: hypothetical protein ABSC55_24945 [Syntrophorhabdales bacterium]
MGIHQGLCSYKGQLYGAWKGEVGDDRLFYSQFNGTKWASQATIAGNSSVGPALAVLSGSMFAAWKGEHSDERLFFAKYTGSAWAPQAQIPVVASSVGPSLAVFQKKLYAAWKGSGSDQSLWYASFDGSNWSAQVQIPGVASSIGPALSEFNGKLYAMWKGSGTDVRLWYASFDGTTWSAQANIPGNSGQDLPQNIGLRMQYQETHEWCWIAVGTSINHFYNPASAATQCGIMTTIGHTINGFPLNTSACPTAAAIASVPGLAAILADPYTATAHNVLDNPTLGIPTEYIKSGGVGDALNVNGNWNKPKLSSLTLAQIATEISAGRPIAVDIAWNSKGQQWVAIAGVLDDLLLICDPAHGETVIQYESFPIAYQGGASLVSACLTQKGS